MGVELLIVNLIAALFVLFFISLVIRTGLSVSLNRRFAYFQIALLGWLIINYLSNQSVLPYELLLLVNRLIFVSSIIAVATMLRFCLSIRSEVIPKRVDSVIWTIVAVGCVLAFTPYLVQAITTHGLVVGVTFSWGGGIYFALLCMLAIATIVRLLYDMIKARGIAKARARTLFATFVVGLVFVTITNVVLPTVFDFFYLSAVGSLVAVVILTGVGYSIIRYRLFDVRSFVTRSLAYVFAVTVLGLVYSIVTIGILSRIANQSVSLSHELPYFVLALFLGVTFQPMKNYFDKVSNRIFYKDQYDVQDVLNQFGNIILGEVRLNKLLDGTLELILQSLKSDFGTIVLLDNAGNIRKDSYSKKNHDINLAQLTEAMKEVSKDIIIVDAEDMNEHERKNKLLYAAVKAMKTNDVQVAVRLKTFSSGLIGYILVGDKRSDGMYTEQDVQLLSLVGGELAVAVENGLRFEEIRSFNHTLQEKVEDATAQLRRKNAELRKLDATKDEFVSMASHQLRTPLTSVKGYISMVLEGDAGKITKMQAQLLGEAFTSSERMVHLINDFLNVSRLQTGKFLIEARPVDLSKITQQEVDGLQTTAHAHNMKLQYRAPSYFPTLYIDENKIRQVLMNFIDNAIYYSQEHTAIEVKLAIEGGDAVLTVHDTGIGVPKSEQAHLFTKFFRATNARRQRPDGTGVGLFLAKKVILAHGGSMVFESVEGEGSTFGFRLPVKQLSASPKNADELKK